MTLLHSDTLVPFDPETRAVIKDTDERLAIRCDELRLQGRAMRSDKNPHNVQPLTYAGALHEWNTEQLRDAWDERRRVFKDFQDAVLNESQKLQESQAGQTPRGLRRLFDDAARATGKPLTWIPDDSAVVTITARDKDNRRYGGRTNLTVADLVRIELILRSLALTGEVAASDIFPGLGTSDDEDRDDE